MKLYTEEQVLKALWEKEHPHSDGKNIDEIMKWLTPIELPSDEEIDESETNSPYDRIDEYNYGFIDGAKWVKDFIIKQNK